MSYNIINNYIEGQPPSASDLNRRAKILTSQLPGALSIFGEGIVQGLEVIDTSGSYSVSPGTAIVHATGGLPVVAISAFTLPVPALTEAETNYVHLALAIPALVGQPETLLGDPPVLIVSDEEELPNAVLLAEIAEDGEITDRRTFIASSSLAARVALLESDVGYTSEDRAIGSVSERLEAMNGEEGVGYDDTALRNRIASLETQLATLQQAAGLDVSVYSETDQLTQAVAVLGNRHNDLEFEVLGRAGEIERQQRAGIGAGFGSAELDGPDFDGYGPAKNVDGTFGGS